MGQTFERCPKAMVANELATEAELAGDALTFREHHLAPNAGGLLDQDARFVEALAIVDSEIAAIRGAAVPHGG